VEGRILGGWLCTRPGGTLHRQAEVEDRRGSGARAEGDRVRSTALSRHVSAIIAAGGRGLRFGAGQPKQLALLAGRTILQHSVDAFIDSGTITDLVVALPPDLAVAPPDYLRSRNKPIAIVEGGARRQDSVRNAFYRLAGQTDIVVIHDAARPLVTDDVIRRTVAAAAVSGAAIAALRASDTVKRGDAAGRIVETLPRDEIYLAQTPQAFQVDVLREALTMTGDATDEAALAERAGHHVQLVDGDPRNLKITTADDLATAERLLTHNAGGSVMRIGNGYDLHRLVPGRPLVLGGVTIPFDKGLLGHSDADVICHAVTDAILGAAGAGDIGRHFPDTDPAWKDANSLELLRQAMGVVARDGFAVGNVDVVVIAQLPKLAPHVDRIRAAVASALGCHPSQVSVKGKTNEGVDSIGAGESIAAQAVALLVRRRS
jgi:2-C-methyl-D-erythritol 4-phosphate cytidylyltransferase/2-C-methyl-D-erythritol 2,4-cyclodiphosphate synthase